VSDVAHEYLITLGCHLPIDGAGIVNRPRAAPTQRLHLKDVHAIREFDETRRTRE
jgi:hypothetical protein